MMFEFVSVDSTGRALQADRLRIRSRAAMEKNKRKDSRRSLREAKRLAIVEQEAACPRLPSPPPHDFRLVPFAEKIDVSSQELLYKVFAFKTLEEGKPPLERCIDFTLWDNACFEWLQQDNAFLQSVLTSAAMVDHANRLSAKESGNKMWFHLHRTIAVLNSRLSDEDAHLKDSTLNVVLTLSLLACALGDRAGLKAHLSGLQKIVRLRGGLAFLRERPMLHFRVNHVDLTWTLMSGEHPFFLPAFSSWKRLFPRSHLATHNTANSSSATFLSDHRLLVVFQDLQHAVWLLNHGVKRKIRHTGNTFQPILSSIQSRLLRLENQLDDVFSECMRLAMLTFLSFAMNFPSIQFRATYLEVRFENVWRLLNMDKISNKQERLALEFWIAVVAAGFLSGFRNDWLTDNFYASVREVIPTWQEANRRLLDVMWIESIHSASGEATFRRLFQHS